MPGFFKPVGDFVRKIADRFVRKPTALPSITTRSAKKSLDELLDLHRERRRGKGGKLAHKAYADGRQKSQRWRQSHGLNFEFPARKSTWIP